MKQSISFARKSGIALIILRWLSSSNSFCSSVLEERVTNKQALSAAVTFIGLVVAIFGQFSMISWIALGIALASSSAIREGGES